MKTLIILALGTALAACAAGPDYKAPLASASATAPFRSTASDAVQPLAPVPANWWKLYHDPVLDGLVADALQANTDVRAAAARVARARALLHETGTQRLPDIDASASGTYGRDALTLDKGFQANAGLGVSYEVDLFGRIGRSVEAARVDVGAASADADAVQVMVAAETARAYVDAGAAAEKIAVAERIVALLDRSLTITQRREEIGETSKLETARLASLVEQRRADVPALAAERDAALFRLALLTGRAPADLPAAAGQREAAPTLNQPIPVGDGASLLARRPDIRAAERRLAAATARIGVATADLYPRITLGGSAAGTGGGIASLLSNPIGWLVGPLISWSFQNHVAARARVEGAEASSAEALAQFDGTVLTSLKEVETALSAYQNQLRRQERLVAARDQAAVALKIVGAQQREGQVDALTLLDAQRTFADTESQLAVSHSQVANAQIDLFRALGGGWTAE